MLKRISVTQAIPGMFIQELCGSWLDNPFWSKSFELKDYTDVQKLQASGVTEMWIHTGKGLDVDTAPQIELPEQNAAPEIAPSFRFVAVDQVSTREELKHASTILKKSRSAVQSMFNDIRMGNMAGIDAATPIVDEIASSVLRNASALISLVRLKLADDYTYMHSVAVCAMMVALGKKLALQDAEVRECGIAGLLHDIGKMAISPAILNKPGRLTDGEFLAVKQHPQAGHALLRQASNISSVALDVCLHHHERIDGAGYPDGLIGPALSLHARMAAICDVYDAITSNRPYKAGWSPAVSLRKMAEWSRDGHFDPVLFSAFIKCIGIYPVGTLVRLRSDRLAVVLDNTKSLLQPAVRVFFSIKSQLYVPPVTVDLAIAGATDEIVSSEDALKWGIQDTSQLWVEQG